jgi:hypothetical protein
MVVTFKPNYLPTIGHIQYPYSRGFEVEKEKELSKYVCP